MILRNYATFLVVIFLTVLSPHLSGENSTEAYTVNGKGVVLHEDGTWDYSGKNGVFDVERNGIVSVTDISVLDLLPCTVMKVIDGDTIKVVFADPPPGIQREESARLLGIDTPELGGLESDAIAKEARDFVSGHIADSVVYLAFDSKWRGSFGRLLAYVFTTQEVFLNAELLSQGLAALYNDSSCHFRQFFVALELSARIESKGMWTAPINEGIVIRQIFNDSRAEYIELWNRTDQAINLSKWYFVDEQNHRIDIPNNISIPADERFYVLSGSDTTPPSPNFVYPTKSAIWNNSGDRARLYDDDGELVAEYEY